MSTSLRTLCCRLNRHQWRLLGCSGTQLHLRQLRPLAGIRAFSTEAKGQPKHHDNGAKEYISFDAKSPVKLRIDQEEPGNREPMLVQTMIRQSVAANANSIAIGYKGEDDKWVELTYAQFFNLIETVAKGFIALGLEESHSVAIMAANCHQWSTSSYASIFAGGLACGIYATSSSEAVAHICNKSDADILVAENLAMLKQAIGGESQQHISQALPSIKRVVLMEATDSEMVEAGKLANVLHWNDLLTIGEQQSDQEMLARESRQAVNKACMLIFTSGTTGPPKGAMLSHDNVTFSCYVSTKHYDWDKEIVMSYLPFSHVAAHLIDNYMVLYIGGRTYYADKNALRGTLVENLKEIRPTKFVGVPRVWEKIKDKLVEAESKAPPLKKAILRWAKGAALAHHNQVMSGKIPYGVEHASLSYKLAHKLVFSKVHAALGLDRTMVKPTGRVAGAAPFGSSTKKYFNQMGLFIAELYGSTECSGPQNTTLERPSMNKDDTTGKPFYGIKTKILNPDPKTGEGEVAVYSRNVFMGYLKEEAKTRDTFTDDGMWKSGDLGIMDAEGFLRITGRIKELIITEGGKNVAPVPIEDVIKSSLKKVISQAVVVGDNQKYLSCLLTLQVVVDPVTNLPTSDLEAGARAWCNKVVDAGTSGRTTKEVRTVEDFMNGPHSVLLIHEIQKAIDHYNGKAESRAHKVQRFCILPQDFSFLGGELGPTLKLKRHVIATKYKDHIDQMYH